MPQPIAVTVPLPLYTLPMSRKSLYLSGDPKADALLTTTPLALLVGLVLDQQVPLEWAFRGPAELIERLGAPLEAMSIATMDPELLVRAFSAKPALHRYPASMAGRVQALCRLITDEYQGEAAALWDGVADADELRRRIASLPGFGEQKARITVALLGKQLGVRPRGWVEASAPFGAKDSFASIADITDAASLQRVRDYKQSMKAARRAQPTQGSAGSSSAL